MSLYDSPGSKFTIESCVLNPFSATTLSKIFPSLSISTQITPLLEITASFLIIKVSAIPFERSSWPPRQISSSSTVFKPFWAPLKLTTESATYRRFTSNVPFTVVCPPKADRISDLP